MEERVFQRIKTLTELQGTSGFEHDIRSYMRKEMTPLVDTVEQDGLGGIYGIRQSKESDSPRVMLAAHMDEVGFMVTQITSSGLFKVKGLGGWNPYVVSSQRYTLRTTKGDYPCVSSSIPPHLLRGTKGQGELKVDEILFDAGFLSDEEALEFGVRPGDVIVPKSETVQTANQKNIISKAWDNRFGCVTVLETLEALQHETLPNTLIAGATVQEEVGLRGAKPAVTKYQPDIFLAVDCSPADDTVTKKGTFGHLGEGTLLRIYDPGFILLPRMREFLLDIAKTHDIPFQYFVSNGGTDAVAAHTMNEGIPSAVIGVPARYIHTHQSIFNISDFEAAKEMAIQTIKALDRSTIETIRKGVDA